MTIAAVLGLEVAAIAVILFVVDRLVRPTHRNARAVAEFLEDWRGIPDRIDPQTEKVLVEGRPGVLERLVDLETIARNTNDRTAQLERNGGANLADVVHRIEEMVQRNRAGIEDQLGALVKQIVEARNVAGQAAVVTARAEEAHHRDHGQLVGILEEMRDRIWERFVEQDARFDEQRLRELTYVAMLHELGIDIELPGTRVTSPAGDSSD